MTLRLSTRLVSFDADDNGKLASLTLADADGTEWVLPATGAFVFIGLEPNTDWLAGVVDLDERGFIVTDRMMTTSVPGVFAAGDIRSGSTKQLAAAVGEGAAAALQIRYHLQQRDAGMPS
jgi:thioredoxin reductase (NADPH)